MKVSEINKVWDIAKGIKSVKDAGEKALLELEKRSPQKARFLCKMIYSGKNPEEVLRESVKSGEISRDQVSWLKEKYSLLKKFGLKLSIPDSIWGEVETLFEEKPKQIQSQNKPIKGF